jgi:hypothetical protein
MYSHVHGEDLKMEARLHLADLELNSARRAVGRTQLEQLQKEAQERGLFLVARKVKAALNGKAYPL